MESARPTDHPQPTAHPQHTPPLELVQTQNHDPTHLSYPTAPPLPVKTRSHRVSPRAVYCCCFPLSSGVWVIPLVLVIPSLLLVLAMNLATFEGVFRINTPVQLKIVYSVIYSLYALLGVVAGVAFHRLVPNRRFKVLIVLYWILIILIITEGVYFGIMMSKLKSKFVSYCQEIPYPGTGKGTPATASPAMPTSVNGGNETVVNVQHGFPHPMPCNKPRAIVGAFYIVGPGGWVILHCAWIMIIALYSKALRREHPADEECGPMRDAGRVYAYQPPPKTAHGFFGLFSGAQTRDQSGSGEKTVNNMEMLSGIHQHQQHPFQTARTSSPAPEPQPTSSGMSAMLRSIKSRSASHSPELDRRQSGQSGGNGQQNSATHDSSDDDSDEEDLQHSHHTRAARGSGSGASTSSRGDIPADGKGWWIRQIEGKRRGEICPCTLRSPFYAEEDGSCWCGKQRQACQTRVSLGSSSQTMRDRDSRSSLLRPVSPGSHSATASSVIDEPLKEVVAAEFKADASTKDAH